MESDDIVAAVVNIKNDLATFAGATNCDEITVNEVPIFQRADAQKIFPLNNLQWLEIGIVLADCSMDGYRNLFLLVESVMTSVVPCTPALFNRKRWIAILEFTYEYIRRDAYESMRSTGYMVDEHAGQNYQVLLEKSCNKILEGLTSTHYSDLTIVDRFLHVYNLAYKRSGIIVPNTDCLYSTTLKCYKGVKNQDRYFWRFRLVNNIRNKTKRPGKERRPPPHIWIEPIIQQQFNRHFQLTNTITNATMKPTNSSKGRQFIHRIEKKQGYVESDEALADYFYLCNILYKDFRGFNEHSMMTTMHQTIDGSMSQSHDDFIRNLEKMEIRAAKKEERERGERLMAEMRGRNGRRRLPDNKDVIEKEEVATYYMTAADKAMADSWDKYSNGKLDNVQGVGTIDVKRVLALTLYTFKGPPDMENEIDSFCSPEQINHVNYVLSKMNEFYSQTTEDSSPENAIYIEIHEVIEGTRPSIDVEFGANQILFRLTSGDQTKRSYMSREGDLFDTKEQCLNHILEGRIIIQTLDGGEKIRWDRTPKEKLRFVRSAPPSASGTSPSTYGVVVRHAFRIDHHERKRIRMATMGQKQQWANMLNSSKDRMLAYYEMTEAIYGHYEQKRRAGTMYDGSIIDGTIDVEEEVPDMPSNEHAVWLIERLVLDCLRDNWSENEIFTFTYELLLSSIREKCGWSHYFTMKTRMRIQLRNRTINSDLASAVLHHHQVTLFLTGMDKIKDEAAKEKFAQMLHNELNNLKSRHELIGVPNVIEKEEVATYYMTAADKAMADSWDKYTNRKLDYFQKFDAEDIKRVLALSLYEFENDVIADNLESFCSQKQLNHVNNLLSRMNDFYRKAGDSSRDKLLIILIYEVIEEARPPIDVELGANQIFFLIKDQTRHRYMSREGDLMENVNGIMNHIMKGCSIYKQLDGSEHAVWDRMPKEKLRYIRSAPPSDIHTTGTSPRAYAVLARSAFRIEYNKRKGVRMATIDQKETWANMLNSSNGRMLAYIKMTEAICDHYEQKRKSRTMYDGSFIDHTIDVEEEVPEMSSNAHAVWFIERLVIDCLRDNWSSSEICKFTYILLLSSITEKCGWINYFASKMLIKQINKDRIINFDLASAFLHQRQVTLFIIGKGKIKDKAAQKKFALMLYNELNYRKSTNALDVLLMSDRFERLMDHLSNNANSIFSKMEESNLVVSFMQKDDWHERAEHDRLVVNSNEVGGRFLDQLESSMTADGGTELDTMLSIRPGQQLPEEVKKKVDAFKKNFRFYAADDIEKVYVTLKEALLPDDYIELSKINGTTSLLSDLGPCEAYRLNTVINGAPAYPRANGKAQSSLGDVLRIALEMAKRDYLADPTSSERNIFKFASRIEMVRLEIEEAGKEKLERKKRGEVLTYFRTEFEELYERIKRGEREMEALLVIMKWPFACTSAMYYNVWKHGKDFHKPSASANNPQTRQIYFFDAADNLFFNPQSTVNPGKFTQDGSFYTTVYESKSPDGLIHFGIISQKVYRDGSMSPTKHISTHFMK